MGDALIRLLERVRQNLRPQLMTNKISDEKYLLYGDQSLIESASGSFSKRYTYILNQGAYKNKVPILTIARLVGVSRNTVKKYLHLNEPPPKIPSRSNLADYFDYVQSRLRQDPNIEIIQLWNDVKENGYNGSRSVFYNYLKGYSKGKRTPTISSSSIYYWSAQEVSVILYRKKNQLSASENELINKLKKVSTDIQSAVLFVSRFRNLIEKHNGSGLQDWMDDLGDTNSKEQKSFAKGLLPDLNAVINAISLLWSNGQVERQINKLNTVKRQMYGRVGFNLLRKRLVLQID